MYDEVIIIQRLKEGDVNALPPIMSKYQDYVYSILKGMLLDQEAAEAAQDSFIKVYKNINSFNGQSKFSTWLYSICYRTGLDYIKKRKKSVELTDINTAAIRESEAHKEFLQGDLSNLLKKEIDKLKSEDAAILRMHYLDELSMKEIAEITNLSESNIKVKLFRCRQQLKERIQKEKTFHYQDYISH